MARGASMIEIPPPDKRLNNVVRITKVSASEIEAADEVSINDFYAHLPTHKYIFVPTRELWGAEGVNAKIPPIPFGDKLIPASKWLDWNRTVEQMAWCPGEPMIISGRLIAEGGWIEKPGASCFNLYRPPTTRCGDARRADRWVKHVQTVYPDDWRHIVLWLAHRVQKPAEKINHALVLGGPQGVGKDSLLEPVKHAIGPWNFIEVSPTQVLGRFNGYLKSIILRVSESRDLGDVDRFSFYDHLKTLEAAPPDVLRCDEKNLREHSVMNVCGVCITSNHKSDGIHLPADDRRHFVAWTNLTKEDFTEDYWRELWSWYHAGGFADVAAYLAGLDLAGFDPKAPPPKTCAFWEIVHASQAPEDAELADALDLLGNPHALTVERIIAVAEGDIRAWLLDRKNRRTIGHRLEQAGYVPVRNDTAKDGLWKLHGRRQAIYARKELSRRDQIDAARHL
jgi:hypothetical protein